MLIKNRVVGLSFFIAALLLTGCNPAATEITREERESVLAFAEPKVDTQMNALAIGDYELFLQDYDEAMIKATTQDSFHSLESLLADKVGAYQSREVASVWKQGNFYIVIYNAKYEKDTVTMRVVFETEGEHRISGLWFDSPKLRQ